MKRKSLALSIVFLFIASTVTPAVISIDESEENDEYLENMNYDSYHFSEITNNDNKITNSFDSELTTSLEFTGKLFNKKPMQTGTSGLMDSAWPMFCHDVRHTGRSPYTPADYPIEKWRYKIGSGGYGSPSIDENGIIYFGGFGLHAMYPNGTLKWTSDDYMNIHTAPAIAEDGTIYVGDGPGGHFFYAFNPNGSVKWKYQTWGIYSSPAIGDDGTIYFGSQDTDTPPLGSIRALYPNGTLKWSFQTSHYVYSSPVIGDDGIIYCGSHDQNLYALYPNNGTEKWRYRTDHWIRTSPCIGDDGTIYVVSLDSYLHAVYPNNGTLKWKTNCGAGTSPTIGQDGTIYCGYSNLYAVNPNGSVKWTFNPGSGRRIRGGTPCNDANGTIYFGTTNDDQPFGGEIIAVDPDGNERWRKLISNIYVESAPCISNDGSIYVVSSGALDYVHYYFHAFGTVESNEPPEMQLVEGPSLGQVNVHFKYIFSASDPDNNPVSYFVDWGDGTTSGWTMDYAPNVEIFLWHKWESQGIFSIRVKARDSVGAESDWSEPLIVNVTTETTAELKNRILFLSGIMHNEGDYDLHNINWELDIQPYDNGYFSLGILKFPKDKIVGSAEILEAHGNLNIRSRIRGVGLFYARLVYKADEMIYSRSANTYGIVLGPFILFFINDPY